MELAFREPIRDTHGDVKFPAGVFREWPRATWQQIADGIGKPLSEITVTKEEAGALVVSKGSSPASKKDEKKVARKSSKKKHGSTKRVRMKE